MGLLGSARLDQQRQANSYMSGNLLSKGIDLLSTTNYAAAGGVDALLSGENPIVGMGEGIMNRRTFVDVLKDRGAPGWVSLPVGLLADVATPVVPGLGLVRLGKSVQIARAMRLAEGGYDAAHTVEGVLGGAEEVLAAKRMTEATAGAELAAGEAAKAAHMAAPEGMGVLAAREAAAGVRGGTGTERLGKQAVAAGDTGQTGNAWSWIKGKVAFTDGLVRQARKMLMDSPMFQGGIGQDFVNGIELQNHLGRRLKGALVERANNIVRLVGSNHVEFMKAANGSQKAVTPAVQQALVEYRKMADELFEAMSKRGVHQTDEITTIAYRRLDVPQRELVRKLVKTEDVQELNAVAATEEGRIAEYVRSRGGRITDGEVVEKPITRVADYIPLIPKRLNRKTMGPKSIDAVSELIQQFNPGMEKEFADTIAERVLADRRINSPDIAKMLQHQRSGWGGWIEGVHVSDPKQVLYKMINDSSDLIAGAHVWGGDWQKYQLLRSRFLELNGISRLAKDMAPPAPVAGALASMDRAFQITQGIYKDPWNPLTGTLSRMADMLFLSPRTILLQPTTMANVGALAGGANALTAVGEFLTNPTMQRLGQRLGAILPNLYHALDEREALKMISKWNPIMKGIAGADAQQRTIAAIAGALHAVDTEEKIIKALQSGNRARAEKLAGLLERRYGLKATEILNRGGQITSEEMFRVAGEVANMTNFTGDVLQLPMAASSSAGKFFLKFKQFSLQQGYFLTNLIQEWRATGDIGPLLRYAAYFPWVYNPIIKVMNQLRPEDIDPDSDHIGYLKNLVMIGGMGFWGDAALSLGSKSEALQLGVITGANVAAGLKMAKAGIKTINPFGDSRFDITSAWEEIKPATVRQAEAAWERLQE